MNMYKNFKEKIKRLISREEVKDSINHKRGDLKAREVTNVRLIDTRTGETILECDPLKKSEIDFSPFYNTDSYVINIPMNHSQYKYIEEFERLKKIQMRTKNTRIKNKLQKRMDQLTQEYRGGK